MKILRKNILKKMCKVIKNLLYLEKSIFFPSSVLAKTKKFAQCQTFINSVLDVSVLSRQQ